MLIRVPYEQVDHVDTAVHLRIRQDELPEPAMDAWLREHVIDRYRERTVRVDEVIRRPVWDRSGECLGRVVDLVTDSTMGTPLHCDQALIRDSLWGWMHEGDRYLCRDPATGEVLCHPGYACLTTPATAVGDRDHPWSRCDVMA